VRRQQHQWFGWLLVEVGCSGCCRLFVVGCGLFSFKFKYNVYLCNVYMSYN
jgi:hypothetical protein